MNHLPSYGYVYVGHRGEQVKIGRSQEPERRRRQLETQGGGLFERWEQFRVYAPAACERELHRRWEMFRNQGEWFGGGRYLFDLVAQYLRPRQTINEVGKRSCPGH